ERRDEQDVNSLLNEWSAISPRADKYSYIHCGKNSVQRSLRIHSMATASAGFRIDTRGGMVCWCGRCTIENLFSGAFSLLSFRNPAITPLTPNTGYFSTTQ